MLLDNVIRQDGDYLFVYILFEDIINDNFDEPFIADVDNTIDRNFTVTFNEQGEIQEIN